MRSLCRDVLENKAEKLTFASCLLRDLNTAFWIALRAEGKPMFFLSFFNKLFGCAIRTVLKLPCTPLVVS